MKSSITILMLSASVALCLSCSSKPCNNRPQNPYTLAQANQDSGSEVGSSDEYKASGSGKPVPAVAPTTAAVEPKESTVDVFKNTGELQCEAGGGISIETAQEALNKSKIKVYSAHTQSDGMMHIALCGSNAGNIHVFKIPKKDLKKAEKLGYKLLKLRK